MSKRNDPNGERVRIREKEAAYIRQVAETYQESFLDALYRIVAFHRDTSLVGTPFLPKVEPTKPAPKVEPVNNDDLPDLDMFA
ncbi:MAG: hypothetical protein KME22_09315 [Hassallia sp. WJT32-NPBG1]|jgi:hypothetical protein|nr:hypothetical protein [Hassallia sp. WJT32-NPBG1]